MRRPIGNLRDFVALLLLLSARVSSVLAADSVGGSVAVTSDYLVRGVSRSNDHPALQVDLDYATSSGLMAGLFASNTQISAEESRDVEASAFVGFVWAASDDWRAKTSVEYYAYPWNQAGSRYDYVELALDLTWRDWLELSVAYDPEYGRFLPQRGVVRGSSASDEVSVRKVLRGRVSGTAGLGYTRVGGPVGGGYAYGSIGLAYDLAPVVIATSFVDTSLGSKSLFFNESKPKHWLATVIWRF